MSKGRISHQMRARVRGRAANVCEYCLLHEDDVIHAFHVDHVISEKHGGPTEEHNLAFCCPFCNRAKGSDIGGQSGAGFVRLYNPRIDVWSEHFEIVADRLAGITPIGEVTARLLGFNDPQRRSLRAELFAAQLFPREGAARLIRPA
jgi:hypothetical protein